MRFIRFAVLFSMLLTITYTVRAKDILYSKVDSLIYESYIKQFAKQQNKPFDEILINTAKYFLESPYTASTLEVSDDEKLIINLQGFDCTTFVENCIALSLVVKSGNTTFDSYCRQLIAIRYRDKKINGYTSRLHYTSDWMYNNERNGLLENTTLKIGGKRIDKIINFMTMHPQLYKQLINEQKNLEELRETEDKINSRNNYIILTKVNIKQNEKSIRNGDIIAFATSIQGLDYTHIGIAYRQTGILHFIHASSKQKKVVIEKRSLSDYCNDSKNCTGISTLRITEN